MRCLLLLVGVLACASPTNTSQTSQPAPPKEIVSTATPLGPFIWSNPRPQSNTLRGIWGDNEFFISVGDAGTILYTNDLGASWKFAESNTPEDLSSIFGISGVAFFAVGKKGTLLTSLDGYSWKALAAQTESDLYSVWGTKEQLWISGSGGLLLHSEDLGQRWETATSNTGLALYRVWGDGERLFAAGAKGTLLRSTDEGQAWSPLTTNARYALRDIWSLDNKTLFVVGDQGTILSSADQGDTWSALQSNTPSHLASIRGDQGTLFAAGQFGNIVRSVDDGKTWVVQQLGDFQDHPRNLFSAFAPTTGVFVAVGDEGLLLRSTDGGVTWSSSTGALRQGIRGATLRNEILFTVGDHGTIYASNDLGAFWQPKASNVNIALQSVITLPDGTLLAVGLTGLVLRSTDGETWATLPEFTKEHLFGAFALKEKTFLVGDNGAIFVSADRGLTWSAQQSNTKQRLFAIWGRGEGELYAVGNEGVILRSADLGKTWSATQLENPYPESASTQKTKPNRASRAFVYRLWDVVGRGENEVYAIGNGGVIWRSLDKGKTWSLQRLGKEIDLLSISSAPDQALYATGTDGAVFQSNDGKEWRGVPSSTAQDLNASLYYRGRLFVFGAFGTILAGKNQ